jgi:hypothetical protein
MKKPTASTASDALKALTPKTKFGEFEAIWPDIEDALNRKLTLWAIWESLHANGLDVSYPTFCRFYHKKTSGLPSPVKTKQANKPGHSGLDHRIQGEAQGGDTEQDGDKANQIISASGSALDQARTTVAKTDYAKLARDAERNKK